MAMRAQVRIVAVISGCPDDRKIVVSRKAVCAFCDGVVVAEPFVSLPAPFEAFLVVLGRVVIPSGHRAPGVVRNHYVVVGYRPFHLTDGIAVEIVGKNPCTRRHSHSVCVSVSGGGDCPGHVGRVIGNRFVGVDICDPGSKIGMLRYLPAIPQAHPDGFA